jgi:crossover junction endodeoxyribonuclease RuvC
MLVLGIDPGTATTGYGLVHLDSKGRLKLKSFGWIRTEKNGSPAKRLEIIHQQMLSLLSRHQPDAVAIERLFFFSNAKTVISVGQAQGVLLLACAKCNIPVYEYTPAQIKKEIGGNGRADKSLMKRTIRSIFSIRAPKRKKTHFDDCCDAIAIALTHIRFAKGGE